MEDAVLDALEKGGGDALPASTMFSALKKFHLSEAQVVEMVRRVFGAAWTPAAKKVGEQGRRRARDHR